MAPLPPPRVMIVESYGANIKSLANHLAAMPFHLDLVTAVDADSALAELEKGAVDLVIADSVLRGKANGYDLCSAVRGAPFGAELPIIILLSGSLSLERCKGIAAGADLLLHRPVVKEELARMIQLLLGAKLGGSKKPSPVVPKEPLEEQIHAVG